MFYDSHLLLTQAVVVSWFRKHLFWVWYSQAGEHSNICVVPWTDQRLPGQQDLWRETSSTWAGDQDLECASPSFEVADLSSGNYILPSQRYSLCPVRCGCQPVQFQISPLPGTPVTQAFPVTKLNMTLHSRLMSFNYGNTITDKHWCGWAVWNQIQPPLRAFPI